MKQHVTLDRFGRVLIPKNVRDEAGITPGDRLEIQSGPEGVVLKPVHGEPHLVDKGGVLVFCGVASGDVGEALRRHREDSSERT